MLLCVQDHSSSPPSLPPKKCSLMSPIEMHRLESCEETRNREQGNQSIPSQQKRAERKWSWPRVRCQQQANCRKAAQHKEVTGSRRQDLTFLQMAGANKPERKKKQQPVAAFLPALITLEAIVYVVGPQQCTTCNGTLMNRSTVSSIRAYCQLQSRTKPLDSTRMLMKDANQIWVAIKGATQFIIRYLCMHRSKVSWHGEYPSMCIVLYCQQLVGVGYVGWT